MFLLDTNVVSEIRKPNPHRAVVAWLIQAPADHLHLSAVTLGEIQDGIERTRRQDPMKASVIEAWLDAVEATYDVIPMSGRVFRCWARLQHTRSDDLMEDVMIAATALVHDMTVVTRNVNDFKELGVRVLDPFKYRRSAP